MTTCISSMTNQAPVRHTCPAPVKIALPICHSSAANQIRAKVPRQPMRTRLRLQRLKECRDKNLQVVSEQLSRGAGGRGYRGVIRSPTASMTDTEAQSPPPLLPAAEEKQSERKVIGGWRIKKKKKKIFRRKSSETTFF